MSSSHLVRSISKRSVFFLSLLFLFATDFTTEGMKALEDRKYQEAADLFAKAVAADPGDYAANFHLALSYSLLGKAAEAIPVYKKVLELKPGLYEAELNLGILLAGQKPANEAIPYLQSAVEKRPRNWRMPGCPSRSCRASLRS